MSVAVKDVMTTRVVAVTMSMPFKELARRLRQYRVSAFPVLDEEGRVVGVVSEADLLTKEALVAGAGLRPDPPGRLPRRGEFTKAGAVTAADLMSTPPVTITAREPVTSAARLMYSCKVKRLPVVDDRNRLVGVVSRTDVLSVYGRPDADIEREIRASNPGWLAVSVKNGIVTLDGHPQDAVSGRAIVDGAWHVEGVVSVRDRLSRSLAGHVEEV